MVKKCQDCKRQFEPKQAHFKLCDDCNRKKRGGGSPKGDGGKGNYQKPSKPDTRFDANYLKDGYYDKNGDMRAEALDTLAVEIAKLFCKEGIKSHQLRRFFNKARGIEAKLRSHQTGGQKAGIKTVESDIYTLKRTVAYQVGREQKLVTDSFKEFIDRNVALAVQGEQEFHAFLQHFEAVLAYFVYYSGEWANKRMGELANSE